MKYWILCTVLISNLVFADIEEARDAMEANQFNEAMQLLRPAANAGNADAEELIGILYAMGPWSLTGTTGGRLSGTCVLP